jgi:hypothetical protein
LVSVRGQLSPVCHTWWREVTEYLGVLIVLGGPVLILGTVALLDWLARRKERQSRDRAA